MIRVVFDANVFVSAIFGFRREASTPGLLLRLWQRGSFDLFVSDMLRTEIERALATPYFSQSISEPDRIQAMNLLDEHAHQVELSETVTGIATHPEDDLVLAAAVSAGVDYLVTGDKMLVQLGSFQGVTILTPRQFLDVLVAQEASGE